MFKFLLFTLLITLTFSYGVQNITIETDLWRDSLDPKCKLILNSKIFNYSRECTDISFKFQITPWEIRDILTPLQRSNLKHLKITYQLDNGGSYGYKYCSIVLPSTEDFRGYNLHVTGLYYPQFNWIHTVPSYEEVLSCEITPIYDKSTKEDVFIQRFTSNAFNFNICSKNRLLCLALFLSPFFYWVITIPLIFILYFKRQSIRYWFGTLKLNCIFLLISSCFFVLNLVSFFFQSYYILFDYWYGLNIVFNLFMILASLLVNIGCFFIKKVVEEPEERYHSIDH